MSSRLPKQSPPVSRLLHAMARLRTALPACLSLPMGDDQVFMPLAYEESYAYPLLVWLPGEAPRPFDLGRVRQRVSLRNLIAVEPRVSPTDSANSLDREDAVWRAIDRVCEHASVHPQRIYLVGQGEGGSDAFRLACRHPQAFAGVISLGGSFPLSEGLLSQLFRVRRLPMLLCCHRSQSTGVAEQTDQTLRLFHAAGAMLAMRIYPGRKNLSKAILNDVNRWVMDDVCGTQVPVPSHCAPS